MISVEQALNNLFTIAPTLGAEWVALENANGRVMIAPVVAKRDQPPFTSSAMDGYAMRRGDAAIGNRLRVIGEAAAGHRFTGPVNAGEAVRIFTGAPLPTDTDFVVIQEDVTRYGEHITINENLGQGANTRQQGADFKAGQTVDAPRLLGPKDIALLAAMNINRVQVSRRPDVALISTGDELVFPGENPNQDQIIASNTFGLAALINDAGARARILPIARDNIASLNTALDLAQGADVIITIGGASVGDHDLVGNVIAERGVDQSFYKVAMRPGKPLMAGKLDNAVMVGLPGNPVSAMVCGIIFLVPMLKKMLGQPAKAAQRYQAIVTQEIPGNGPREHYMRATLDAGKVTLADRQDSALLSVLTTADALVVRPPNAPAARVGDTVDYILL
jgi:molybdopterin molybdotransferase